MQSKREGVKMNIKLSHHAAADRIERLVNIAATIGIGEEIVSFPYTDQKQQKIQSITDTGVLLVMSSDRSVLITAYMVTISKAFALYKDNGMDIPPKLIKTIQYNLKKHKQLFS